MPISVTQISGVGLSASQALRAQGFDSVEKIAVSDVKSLCTVAGFGPVRAKATIAAAKKLTAEAVKSVKAAKKKAKKTVTKPKSEKKSIKAKSKKKKKDKAKSDKKSKKRKKPKDSKKVKRKSKKSSKKKGKKKK